MTNLRSRRMRPVVAASLPSLALACTNPFESRRATRLHIQAIDAPDTVAATATLPVTVTVQLGGCLEFTKLVATRVSANRVEIEARGTEATGNVACPANVEYRPVAYAFAPPFADPLTVAALEPPPSSYAPPAEQVRVR